MKVAQQRKALMVPQEALKLYLPPWPTAVFRPLMFCLVPISELVEAAGALPQIKPFLLVDVSSFILSLIRNTQVVLLTYKMCIFLKLPLALPASCLWFWDPKINLGNGLDLGIHAPPCMFLHILILLRLWELLQIYCIPQPFTIILTIPTIPPILTQDHNC